MILIVPTLLRGWRAALLLAAVAFLTPGRAMAECGDYLTLGSKAGRQHAEHQATPTGAATETTQQSPAPSKPCSGPNCSNAPVRESPPIPPAPSVTGQAKEAARLLDSVDHSGTNSGGSFPRNNSSSR